MDKIAINIKAANLCGWDDIAQGQDTEDACSPMRGRFNIFTNPADREATVIALGEKHNIHFQSNGEYWYSYYDNDDDGFADRGTYTEALAAAVDAI